MRPWLLLLSLSWWLCGCPGAGPVPSTEDAGTPPGATSGLPAELRPPTGAGLERPPESTGLPEHLRPPR